VRTSDSEICAACAAPIEHKDQGADVRLYLGPDDKLAELWLPLCSAHLERFAIASREGKDVVECRIARVSCGAGRFQ
jgi:hypothetical protein